MVLRGQGATTLKVEECGCCTGGDMVGECKEMTFAKSNNSPFEFEHQSHVSETCKLPNQITPRLNMSD